PGAPSVSFGLYLMGGRTGESSADAGITRLAASTLRRGTTSRSGEQIDRELELLGTELELDVDSDAVGLHLDVLRDNLRPALDLVADVALRPTFPAEGVEEERALQLAAIRRGFDSSFQRPAALAYGALYGTHPYGLPSVGTADSVAAAGAGDLAAWWRGLATADNAVLLLVGDVDAAEGRALVERAFADLPRGDVARTAVRTPQPPPARLETIEYRDRKQSAIVMLFPAPPPTHPDAPKLELLQRVTSGLAGTFFAELRGRRSLAYTVFAGYQPRREGGAFLAYLASDAAKEPEAKEALIEELRKLATDGFTADDMARGKSSYAGATRIGLQTNRAQLGDLIANHVLGLGLDGTEKTLAAAEATSLEELRAAAGRYAGQEAFVTAILRGKAPAAAAASTTGAP
ncbi:MAG: insulinase family protein, partial [Acidobacteria bacterium]|nr:insulinase family protein [Acidobacteriota bacterium]